MHGIDEAMGLLTACGLGEPASWLRRFDQLSEGERFRARLARAISMHRRMKSRMPAPLLCDEFGASLHRRIAQAIAFNLRKLATRERLALVIATSRDDVEADLCADQTIELPDLKSQDLKSQISESQISESQVSESQISEFQISESEISDCRLSARVQPGDVPSFACGFRIEPADLHEYARFAPYALSAAREHRVHRQGFRAAKR